MSFAAGPVLRKIYPRPSFPFPILTAGGPLLLLALRPI
jgi:hypothetical protein